MDSALIPALIVVGFLLLIIYGLVFINNRDRKKESETNSPN
ncbi:MAG TPA: hypothetical protein VIS75_00640 [Chitinophagaceae bacterium]